LAISHIICASTGKKDPNLLGAAAHLLQDASCPDHWYPTRKFFGRIFVPFAPGWVGTIEPTVESYLRSGKEDWEVTIEFQGRTVTIDEAYLDAQREYIEEFLSEEPEESLQQIESQIRSKILWRKLRSYKEWIILTAVITAPFLAYDAWKWKKGKKSREKIGDIIDTAIAVSIFSALTILLLLIQLFY